MDENELSDAEIEEQGRILAHYLKQFRPMLKGLTEECLRQIWQCESEDSILRFVVKMESLLRNGFGREDNIH